MANNAIDGVHQNSKRVHELLLSKLEDCQLLLDKNSYDDGLMAAFDEADVPSDALFGEKITILCARNRCF